MNVDQSEIAKFSALAHRWWDPQSEFKPLHAINPLRLNWIKSFVDLHNHQTTRMKLRWSKCEKEYRICSPRLAQEPLATTTLKKELQLQLRSSKYRKN